MTSPRPSPDRAKTPQPQARRLGEPMTGIVKSRSWANRAGIGPKVSRFVYGSRPHVPDYMIKSGVKYRLVTDHLGSVRLVVNATTGETVSRIDYDVWGQVTAATNLSFQPFGFAGGLRDDATGLVRFGARDYDPHVGRWTAKDPIGFGGGQGNIYCYSGGDPVNYIDHTGALTAVIITFDYGIASHVAVSISNANGSTIWDPGGSFPAREEGYVHDNNVDDKNDKNASLLRYVNWAHGVGSEVELYPLPLTVGQEEEMRDSLGGGTPGMCANSVASWLNSYGPYKGKFGWALFPGTVQTKLRSLLYGL